MVAHHNISTPRRAMIVGRIEAVVLFFVWMIIERIWTVATLAGGTALMAVLLWCAFAL